MLRNGFTLLEILVASLIIVITVILIHGSFSIITSIWQKRQILVNSYQDVRIALDVLRERLTNTYISPWDRKPTFMGRHNSIRFNSVSQMGILNIRCYVTREGCLVLKEDLENKSIATILCKYVKNIDIRYYDGTSWKQTWQEINPPVLVKIFLSIKMKNKENEFEIVVPIRVTQRI
jgi:prepilin-type N-terminal cleavage/methylation domain-containing protein